jgi:hypothetical protein
MFGRVRTRYLRIAKGEVGQTAESSTSKTSTSKKIWREIDERFNLTNQLYLLETHKW